MTSRIIDHANILDGDPFDCRFVNLIRIDHVESATAYSYELQVMAFDSEGVWHSSNFKIKKHEAEAVFTSLHAINNVDQESVRKAHWLINTVIENRERAGRPQRLKDR